jgi:dipeptidyl aminopeptidase/acylaminoacyl peptidase
MEALTRHGYAVIKPDYRGQGRSPGVAEGAYYSDAYVIDVLSLVTAIKQTEHLDHAGMGIAGHSMGGYIALKAAVVSPDIKAAVVLAGAVGDAQELYAWEPVSVRTSAVAEELKERVTALHGTPTDNPQYWANTSPLTFLRDLHGPVQVHVGSADAQVPAVFSAELQHKLAAAGAVSSYFEYPGGDHSLAAERGLIWPRVVELFDGALGVSTARTSQVPRLPPALQRP